MSRPTVETASTADDIEGWYWTRAELDAIAKRFAVSRAGSKADLTARLRAVLAGEQPPPPPRRASGTQIEGEPSLDTVVPAGQRMTRAIRDFMVGQVGPGFRFDSHMRAFFAQPEGRTLADAVALWHATRGQRPEPTEQFEYNRFTKAFRAQHPDAGREQLLAAWEEYKATAVQLRGRA